MRIFYLENFILINWKIWPHIVVLLSLKVERRWLNMHLNYDNWTKINILYPKSIKKLFSEGECGLLFSIQCGAINQHFERSSSTDCEYSYKYVNHKLVSFINNLTLFKISRFLKCSCSYLLIIQVHALYELKVNANKCGYSETRIVDFTVWILILNDQNNQINTMD